MVLKLFLIQLFLGFIIVSNAMASHKIFADVRYRYEYLHNFNKKFYGSDPELGKADDGFLLQRIRLGFKWIPAKNLELSMGLQDSRAFGVALSDDQFYKKSLGRQHNPYKDYLEPFNTYISIKNIMGHNLSLKAGRQLIYYGDKRVFGPGQWGNTGRYQWDAVKISYKFGKNFIDGFWGANMVHDPNELSWLHRHYFYGGAIYSHFEIDSPVGIEPFFVTKYDPKENYSGESGVGDFNAFFPGVRIYGRHWESTFYDFTYVHNWGNYGSDRIDAFGYHLLLGYDLPKGTLNPTMSIEYSYASGDSDPYDGTSETFKGVFGSRDKMYGRINFFDWSNLKDAQFNLEFRPTSKAYIKIEFHKFWLADKKDGWSMNPKLYRDKTGRSGDEVGREIDLIFRYPLKHILDIPWGEVGIMLGYSHFWPDEFAKTVADTAESDWFFFQIRYKLDSF